MYPATHLAAAALLTLAAAAATSEVLTPATEEMSRATKALQAQDYAGVVHILEPVMARHALDAPAWRTLGMAQLRQHHAKAAESAYLQALSADPRNPQPMFYLGLAAAQQNDRQGTLHWLQKAAATHRVDMTALAMERDIEAWRDSPEFQALLPSAEDFKHPFIEPVRILKEWDGEAAGDQFGWVARVIGDVDGDGVNDFVTSAPTKDIHGKDAGRIYLYSGGSGTLLWSRDGAPGDQLGTGAEAAGDVDGDGIPDVIAGAPGIDTAYVLSGRDGHLLLTLHGEAHGDNFGDHVASVGDIDGDGHADVIVGAAGNGAAGKNAGRAYVYSGKDGHLLLTLSGEAAGDGFGSTVAGYSDRTHRLLVVGAPGAGPQHTGRIYVYRDLNPHANFTADADATGAALGYMFVSVLGDVDGDGWPDIFASDFSDSSKGTGTGKIYIYSGRTGRRLHVWTGQTAGEGFGTTQSIAGDVNGDHRADVIVGSWQYSGAAQSGGRAYLFDGRSGHLLRTFTCRIPGDTFGFDAVGLGYAGDAREDSLLVTSAWSGIHGYHSGRVFLIGSGVRKAANR